VADPAYSRVLAVNLSVGGNRPVAHTMDQRLSGSLELNLLAHRSAVDLRRCIHEPSYSALSHSPGFKI